MTEHSTQDKPTQGLPTQDMPGDAATSAATDVAAEAGPADAAAAEGHVTEAQVTDAPTGSVSDPGSDTAAADDGTATSANGSSDSSLAAERLVDLQRLQAEYVNYKRRVERDRAVAGDVAVSKVLESLLPVLDDVYLAQQHGDLEGSPFASIADKLDSTLAKQGLQRYGQPGEPFDPTQHEALMRTEAELAEGTSTTTVVQVLQPGYRIGERILRPARVAVADPS